MSRKTRAIVKIGVFDSGYGGLTILDKIRRQLPDYDYIYLGDNARAPYGSRSFEVIYHYTLQAVRHLENEGCRLIILACNTASAKALRTIQQHDIDPSRLRVLGVIRPTVEAVSGHHIGVLATQGTVQSESYVLELRKQRIQLADPSFANTQQTEIKVTDDTGDTFPCADGTELYITQQACPMWVPLIESGEHLSQGADWFVDKYLTDLWRKDPLIDTLILGCTHYPLLLPKIQAWIKNNVQLFSAVRIIEQGDIVARSLRDYLQRHTDIAAVLSQGGTCRYLTSEQADKFNQSAGIFLNSPVSAEHIRVGL
ncbi:MAG: aspartate/glutamate racemase family protein [Paludibacteraceae bacterium]|nr:aspartate/glutamate racemase family protein [Paludibacteraceae bacterium]